MEQGTDLKFVQTGEPVPTVHAEVNGQWDLWISLKHIREHYKAGDPIFVGVNLFGSEKKFDAYRTEDDAFAIRECHHKPEEVSHPLKRTG